MKSIHRFTAAAALAFSTLLVAGQALAQAYPSRPVRIVVPYPAGGPADVLVRGLGQKLSELWDQPVVADNRLPAPSWTDGVASF